MTTTRCSGSGAKLADHGQEPDALYATCPVCRRGDLMAQGSANNKWAQRWVPRHNEPEAFTARKAEIIAEATR
jgi:hypothetical protein